MNPWSKMSSDNQAMLKKPLKGMKKQPVDEQLFDQIDESTPDDSWWKQPGHDGELPMFNPYSKAKK